MKTALGLAASLVILGSCARAPEPERTSPGSVEHERITRFWETFRQARDLQVAGRCADAIPLYESALRLDPRHADSLYQIGDCLVRSGRYAEALERYRELVRVSPDRSPRAWAQIGAILSSMEPGAPTDLEQATAAFEQQQALNPEESGPYLSLAGAAMHRGHRDQALAWLGSALGLNPGSAAGHYLRGLVLLEGGEEAKAATELARAVELGRPKAKAMSAPQEGDTHVTPPLSGVARRAQDYLDWLRAPAAELATGREVATALPLSAGSVQSRADFDGDGIDDLLIATWREPLQLLQGDGRGGFTDVTASSGLERTPIDARAAVLADLDGDGRPEVFVTPWRPCDGTCEPRPAGRPRLWKNVAGRFVDASDGLGFSDTAGTMAAVVVDANRDGRPDLFLGNGGSSFADREPSWLLVNQGGLHFSRRLLRFARLPDSVVGAAPGPKPDQIIVAVGGLYPTSGRRSLKVSLDAR